METTIHIILLLVFTSLPAELLPLRVSGYRSRRALSNPYSAPRFYTGDLLHAGQAPGGNAFGHYLETPSRSEGHNDAYSASPLGNIYPNNLIGGHDVVSNDLEDVFSLAQKAILASRASLEISRTQSRQGDDRSNGNHETVHRNRHPPHRLGYGSPRSESHRVTSSRHPERLRHMDTPTFQDYHR